MVFGCGSKPVSTKKLTRLRACFASPSLGGTNVRPRLIVFGLRTYFDLAHARHWAFRPSHRLLSVVNSDVGCQALQPEHHFSPAARRFWYSVTEQPDFLAAISLAPICVCAILDCMDTCLVRPFDAAHGLTPPSPPARPAPETPRRDGARISRSGTHARGNTRASSAREGVSTGAP